MTLTQAIQEIKEAAASLDGYMSIKEAALYAGMSVAQLRRLTQQGFVKCCKNGHRYMYKRDWIDEYYSKNANKF